MQEPYADIHHFEKDQTTGMVDDDGDPCSGWYFQLMAGDKEPITSLIGPYGDESECQEAAQKEYLNLH